MVTLPLHSTLHRPIGASERRVSAQFALSETLQGSSENFTAKNQSEPGTQYEMQSLLQVFSLQLPYADSMAGTCLFALCSASLVLFCFVFDLSLGWEILAYNIKIKKQNTYLV